jgi:hypothetical protein
MELGTLRKGSARPRARIMGPRRNRPPAPAVAHSSSATARIPAVDLARMAWLITVLACLITALVLLLQGYFGYAGVTFAVALSAAINLT